MIITKESFLKDVSGHTMTILLDQGVHRHLLFKNPGSGYFHFHIVTYPGALVFSGDMGCYVFERLNDMFDFFTESKPNLGYWAEKVEAECKTSKVSKFSFERFKATVLEEVEDHISESGWSVAAKEALRKDVNEELKCRENNPYDCFQWAGDFEHEGEEGNFSFQDFWEHNCDEYTPRFVWCCWAIIYAIARYKEHVARSVLPTEEIEEEV
jgi:hypothetical protein